MKTGWILMALLVAGCTTSERYQDDTSSWIGRSKAELIAAWGPPDSDTTIPPNFGAAREGCIKSGVGLFMDVETAAEALKRCADNMIANWDDSGSVHYSWDETVSYFGVAPTYSGTIVGNTVTLKPYGGSALRTDWRYCQTTFEVRNNIVVGVESRGNYCKN